MIKSPDGRAAFRVYTYKDADENLISKPFKEEHIIESLHFRGMAVKEGRLEDVRRNDSGIYGMTLQSIDVYRAD